MDEEKLIRTLLAAVFGISVLGMVGIMTGSIDLGSTGTWELADVAVIMGGLSLAAGTALHGRTLDSYETYEYVAVGVAVAILVVSYTGQPAVVDEWLHKSTPWTELGAGIIAFAGYYVTSLGRA